MTLKEVLSLYEIEVDDKEIETYERYINFLLNSPVNLTSFEREEAYHKVVADTLIPLKDFPILYRFADIGTGGGIPGVVVSIRFNVEGTLIDSTKKKIEVLRRFVEEEKLPLSLVWSRAEELAHQREHRGKYLYVFSRAVADMPIVLELAASFAQVGGYVLLYKGQNWKEELERSWKAMEVLGLDLGDVIEYKLRTGERRAFIILEKIENTPKKYPRKYNQIKKKPLG